MSAAEKLLIKLRKQDANRVCVNCKATSRLGFGAVCMKFGTFVCNNCKSAHQSYSHLVKSVTMSHWNMEEVEKIQENGNARARAKWYANCTDNDEHFWHLAEDDHLDRFKELIFMVYEKKRWYDENATNAKSPASSPKASEKITKKPSNRAKSNGSQPKAQEVDLLSFDFGDHSSGQSQTSQMAMAPKSPNAMVPDGHQSDSKFFFLDQPANNSPANTAQNKNDDLFFMSSNSPRAPASASSNSFLDQFSNMSMQSNPMPNVVSSQNPYEADPFLALQQAAQPPRAAAPNQQQRKWNRPPQQQPQQQQQQQMPPQQQFMSAPVVYDPSDPFAGLITEQPKPQPQRRAAPAQQRQPVRNTQQQQQQQNGMRRTPQQPAQQPMRIYDPNDPFAGL